MNGKVTYFNGTYGFLTLHKCNEKKELIKVLTEEVKMKENKIFFHKKNFLGKKMEFVKRGQILSFQFGFLPQTPRIQAIKLTDKPEIEENKTDVKKAEEKLVKRSKFVPEIVKKLKDFNNKAEELKFSKSLFDCMVCFSQKMGRDCLKFTGCGHVFCSECMAGHFRVKIQEGSVTALTCPQEKCDSQATPGQVTHNYIYVLNTYI